jgi:hypothetical protein
MQQGAAPVHHRLLYPLCAYFILYALYVKHVLGTGLNC